MVGARGEFSPNPAVTRSSSQVAQAGHKSLILTVCAPVMDRNALIGLFYCFWVVKRSGLQLHPRYPQISRCAS